MLEKEKPWVINSNPNEFSLKAFLKCLILLYLALSGFCIEVIQFNGCLNQQFYELLNDDVFLLSCYCLHHLHFLL